MASIRLIAEDEATGTGSKLSMWTSSRSMGSASSPNLYRATASNPDYLEANWRSVKGDHGRLRACSIA